MKYLITIAAAALLALPAAAADRCTELATFAANIAEAREAGIPQVKVLDSLRAQYLEDTEEQRNANAMTERVVVVVYQIDKKPDELRRDLQERCDKGEFDQKARDVKKSPAGGE